MSLKGYLLILAISYVLVRLFDFQIGSKESKEASKEIKNIADLMTKNSNNTKIIVQA